MVNLKEEEKAVKKLERFGTVAQSQDTFCHLTFFLVKLEVKQFFSVIRMKVIGLRTLVHLTRPLTMRLKACTVSNWTSWQKQPVQTGGSHGQHMNVMGDFWEADG